MTEQTINFERMEYALTLFGNSDENIRMLEQGYGVSVVFRGTDIKVSGDAEKVMSCTRCIEGLLKMVESGATEHSSSPASTSGQESFEPKFVTGMIAERIFTGT